MAEIFRRRKMLGLRPPSPASSSPIPHRLIPEVNAGQSLHQIVGVPLVLVNSSG